MIRKQALIELRNKVKDDHSNFSWLAISDTGLTHLYAYFYAAWNKDSLDAAKALHEALLPGWYYNIAPGFAHVFPHHDNGDQEAQTGLHDTPSRAWLLAILEALIAQEPDT